MLSLRTQSLRWILCFTFFGGAALLSGCGMVGGAGGSGGSTPLPPIGSSSGPAAISGRIHGGQQPVGNAAIQIYQVGTTGYTSQATPLLTSGSVFTNASGVFTIIPSNYITPNLTT